MAELNTLFYKKNEIKTLSEQEKVISYYIYKNSPAEDYSELIKDDNRYIMALKT